MTVAVGPSQHPILTDTFEAGASLASSQFYGVELGSGRTVTVCNAETDIPIGIVQNDPGSGEAATIMIIGKTKIVAGETIAPGQQIRIHSDGKAMIFAVDTDVTAYCIGMCTLGADAGENIEAVINCTNPFRGEE